MLRSSLDSATLACGLGVFVAAEALAGPRPGVVAAMYEEAARLAVTAEEAERALARADSAARPDIVAGLDAVLGRWRGATAGDALTPTKAAPR